MTKKFTKIEDMDLDELKIELGTTLFLIDEAYENCDTDHAETLEDHAEWIEELIDELSE